LAAGHRVTVWNRDRAKAERFAARGATVAADLAEAARANTVMTMLADDAAVEAVVFGDGGLLAAGSDLLHVSCSTVSVGLAGRLAAAHAAAGQRFVSAQVLSRPDVAAAGKLSVIAAGEADEWTCRSSSRSALTHDLRLVSKRQFIPLLAQVRAPCHYLPITPRYWPLINNLH
jgi:3-hydroxyisobutyrate dehydrogenase-like beta-hydroxyacid dehydrogenase